MRTVFSIRLSATAQQNLQAISAYSLQIWGAVQTEKYLSLIEQGLSSLLDNPEIGIARPDIKSGYRCLAVEKHRIFYQINTPFIDVLAILHSRMDIKNNFNLPS